jgi:O-methyltransferase
VNEQANLYLELIKKCLTNIIYGEDELIPAAPSNYIKRAIVKVFRAVGITLARANSYSYERRAKGLDWPPFAHTMIGLARLNNIQYCTEDILMRKIPGDLIETGVWRGGATIFMRAILKAYNVNDRNVWVADSFEGLPIPDAEKYPQDKGDLHHTREQLAVSIETVKSNFQKYDLLDRQVRFLKGWFKDTLPTADIKTLALIRLDGDMYQSTMDAMENLYPKLSIGGYVIVDDWGSVAGCRQAIEDYRLMRGIVEVITPIDEKAVYWKREN